MADKIPRPVKILEFGPQDWMKGYSVHPTTPTGGLFYYANNFDPFAQMGLLTATKIPTGYSTNLTESVKYLTSYVNSGTSSFYGQSATKLFSVNASTGGITDVTANATVSTQVYGATVHKNKYIYSVGNGSSSQSLYSTALPAAGATQILADTTHYGSENIFCQGADGNLYFTNSQSVGVIKDPTTTTGNSAAAFTFQDTSFVARDLVNDATYLVIIADNNSSKQTGKFRCTVSFWDMAKGNLDKIYEIDDSYLISAKIINGMIYVIGHDNLYACSFWIYPQIMWPFGGQTTVSSLPSSPAQVIKYRNSLLWGNTSGSAIYGFGNLIPGQPQIMYQPYTATAGNITALGYNGWNFWAAVDTPKIYNFTQGTTYQDLNLHTADIDLPTSYSFAFARVVTHTPLAANETIELLISLAGGQATIMDTTDQSYASGSRGFSFLFFPKAGSSLPMFDNLTFTLNLLGTGGSEIRKIEIWGFPADSMTQYGG